MSYYPYREPYEEGVADGRDESKERITELEKAVEVFTNTLNVVSGEKAELAKQLSALRELLRRVYDSQAITNNTYVDLVQWADDALPLLQEVKGE